jgi:hypothetical protein
MNLEFGKPFHRKTVDQRRAIGGIRTARNRRLYTAGSGRLHASGQTVLVPLARALARDHSRSHPQ